MSVHEGIDGVTRKNIHLLLGRSGVRRQAYLGFAGIDGVARQFLDVLDAIDHIKISLHSPNIDVYTISNEYIGYGIDTASDYGSVSVGTDTITVRCTRRGYKIRARAYGFIVFKTGEDLDLNYLTKNSFITNFLMSVSVYLSANLNDGHGQYDDSIFGDRPIEGYFYDYTSTTKNIIPTRYYCDILAGIEYGSGTFSTTVTFNSCTINGRTIPIRLINDFS